MPNKAFYSLKCRTFGLGQTKGANRFWSIWGIFGQTISTHFGTVSPLSMFPRHYSTIISTKKLSLYIHIQTIYLESGFEFEFGTLWCFGSHADIGI
jgi:hypothetical protein